MKRFYAFTAELWYRHSRRMTQAEKGDYMDATADALADGARGITPLADALIDEAETFIGKKREAGRMGGIAKARNAAERERMAQSSSATKNVAQPSTALAKPTPTDRPTDQPTYPPTYKPIETIPPVPPTPPPPPKAASVGSDKISGKGKAKESAKPIRKKFSWADLTDDKYGYMKSIANEELIAFVLWYCGESDNERAGKAYDKFIRKFGWSVFRTIMERFVADTESGEEPDVRGAAFMAALKRHNVGGKDGP